MITIEVIYVPLKNSIVHMTLHFEQRLTVSDALNASGIYANYPETIDFAVGIFSKQVARDYVLNDGDRIEIYRPLILDPKENRRKKANVLGKKNKQIQ